MDWTYLQRVQIGSQPTFCQVLLVLCHYNPVPFSQENLQTERVTRDYLYDLLYSAKEAHMNMLRVWGGLFLRFSLSYMIRSFSI